MVKCHFCGKEFAPHSHNHIYCSACKVLVSNKKALARYHANKNLPKPHKRHTCVVCGNTFQPQYRGQKYCSDACRQDPAAVKLRRFFSFLFNLTGGV